MSFGCYHRLPVAVRHSYKFTSRSTKCRQLVRQVRDSHALSLLRKKRWLLAPLMDLPMERPTAAGSVMGTPSSLASTGQRQCSSLVLARFSTPEYWSSRPVVNKLSEQPPAPHPRVHLHRGASTLSHHRPWSGLLPRKLEAYGLWRAHPQNGPRRPHPLGKS